MKALILCESSSLCPLEAVSIKPLARLEGAGSCLCGSAATLRSGGEQSAVAAIDSLRYKYKGASKEWPHRDLGVHF